MIPHLSRRSRRAQGALVGEAWGSDGDLVESLTKAVADAKSKLPAGAAPDMIVLDLAHKFRTIRDPVAKELYRFASGKRTGVRGIELSYGEERLRVPPTTMLVNGERFKQVADRFFKDRGIDHDGFVSGGGQARVFESQQLIVRLPGGEGVGLLRGNVYVEPSVFVDLCVQFYV